jgi:hypothetical protein
VLALELEMLPDGIVEKAHPAEAYRGSADASAAVDLPQPAATTRSARSTRFFPARLAL